MQYLLYFYYHFRKTIIILIMHYVYKRHKKTNQEYTKVGIYLNKLGRYKFKMAKGLQRCLPNEHLDSKENDFPISFSEDQSLLITQTSQRYSGFKRASFFSSCTNPLYLNRLLQVFNPSNPLVNLSRPLRIFNLNSFF